MKNRFSVNFLGVMALLLFAGGCSFLKQAGKQENKAVPSSYHLNTDTVNSAYLNWRTYFSDQNLIALIDTSLKNNQELNIFLQEIEQSKNEIRARKGEYLPFVGLRGGSGVEKEGRYTRFGAVDEQLDIKPGKSFPVPFTDQMIGAYATWEIDIWKKLRNAKKSAVLKYLASMEGKNFLVTNLIAEISEAYYELMASDNLLKIIEQNIAIQTDVLDVVKQQKAAGKLSQLAVNRFEAQLLNTKNRQFSIRQNIVETENRINFLTGRFPKPIKRSSEQFLSMKLDSIQEGIPSQLLINRPDIVQAEYELAASKLDVKVARANFYPSLGLKAGIGFQAFNPTYLFNPESILYNAAGDLMSPLINRNAIKAAYNIANARQIQAVYHYEQTILNAYVEVVNQLAKVDNFTQSFETKSKEVDILVHSITIANSLFNAARADYAEVLLTQREALVSKTEVVEIRAKQLGAKVNIYRALGGGWR